ncbi:MAG TPA: hypothetical protein VFE84_04605 [Patescibacteria group bacterium]|nr:hypothetical protein [Patescibacteria group bacterium]
MTLVSILLSLLSLLHTGRAFERRCYQQAFQCTVTCAGQQNAAAQNSCLNTCESRLSSCLD